MRRSAYLFVVASTAVVVTCTDPVTEPGRLEALPELTYLIVSNPTDSPANAGMGGNASIAYLSLRPRTLPEVAVVRIRNLSSGGAPGVTVPVIDGGFDPVEVEAREGDELELELTYVRGTIGRASARVPRSRPPTIVRTSPPPARTDVALGVIVRVVFSEPLDALSVTAASVKLQRGATPVPGAVEVVKATPWLLEFVPASPLEPETTYQLVVTQAVQDLQGERLESPVTVTFSTGAAPASLDGRIAFVSDREGAPHIYVADDFGEKRLTDGARPAWSPDGRRIAYQRGPDFLLGLDGSTLPHIYLVDDDGSNPMFLVAGQHPAWSPDGTRIAFASGEGISIIGVDGSELRTLVRHEFHPGTYKPWDMGVGHPAWSPDGQSIAFLHLGDGDLMPAQIYVIPADGSTPPRRLTPVSGAAETCTTAGCVQYAESDPAWSPDGAQILFWSYGYAIAVVNATGGTPSSLAAHLTDVAYGSKPVWAPDGRRITFTAGRYSSREPSILSMVVGSLGVQLLIANAYDGVWAPR